MTQTAARPSPLSPEERWTLAATVVGSSMAFLDGTVVNVALASLQADLNATAAGVQWVVNAYALLLAALTLSGGALGDAYGRNGSTVLAWRSSRWPRWPAGWPPACRS